MRKFFLRVTTTVAVGASLVGACAVAAPSEDSLVAPAYRELAAVLHRDRPDIVAWEIAPLLQASRRDVVPLDARLNAEVLKSGARSAVRMSWGEPALRHSRTIWFDVVGRQQVLVTTRDVTARQPLAPADVAFEARDVLSIHCVPLQANDAAIGMRTKHALRTGAPVCREAIEPQPAVARGDNVVVHYESARVSLTTKGVAQQDAHIGQLLRVVNPATQDSFAATVSGIREVVIHE